MADASPDHPLDLTKIPCPHCGAEVNGYGLEPLAPLSCPECEGELVVPVWVDHYRITRMLGAGAMGRVYLADDSQLYRQVAVKVLRSRYASSPRMWAAIAREAKLAASVHHVNVVQIYRLGRLNGRPYIIMELVPHMTLESYNEENRISEKEWIRITIDILKGLEAANSKGLVHGDVKPANILITPKGMAKVADFGLARNARVDHTVERWGTPYYMAPEKSALVQEDFRSDLYSLGTSLFHCLAGRAPFEGESAEEVIEAAIAGEAPSLREFCPWVSDELVSVVDRMTRHNPDERYSSYKEAILTLKQMIQPKRPHPDPNHKKQALPGIQTEKRPSLWGITKSRLKELLESEPGLHEDDA